MMLDVKGYTDTLISHVHALWNSVCSYCLAKGVIGVVAAAFWAVMGVNNQTAIAALIGLISIDFITALGGAYSSNVPIESRRALKSATKLIVYFLFVAAGHLTGVAILGTNWVETAVISFLALTELVSIMENIGKMGYSIPQKLLNRVIDLRNEK